ncbi:hypothetical protein SEPCBS119000_005229 [Sporothrix epigloea]|uniref:Ankyrin repeat protein n=1 Tax=Sporothrix epigloea TaxID=1892477 RepID=A0ABP0DWH0_9PEZI
MPSLASSALESRHLRLIAASAQADKACVREILAEAPAWITPSDHDALRQSLQEVAGSGNLALTRLLLEKKAEIEPKHENEVPALYRAAEAGHHAVVKELLLKYANQNEVVPSRLGQTALFAACFGGHDQIVCLLLDHGADVEIRDEQGCTVLLYLASEKDGGKWTMDTLRLLLGHGYANIEARDTNGLTPLLWAVTNGNLRLAEALLDGSLLAASDTSAAKNRGQTALHIATEANDEAMVCLLLRYEADPNVVCYGGWTPLHQPAQNGHKAVVSLLLRYKADPNVTSDGVSTPLHSAAEYGHEAVVSLLLDAGADVNAILCDGTTALHLAAEANDEAVVRLLLEYKADPNAIRNDRWTPLHCAAHNGDEAVVSLLLDSGANVNAMQLDGVTALHLAAHRGSVAVVKLLLKYKADPNAFSHGESTPLHNAAPNGHEAVVSLLLDAGANVDTKLYNGMTALYLAAGYGSEAVVKLLLRYKADPNAASDGGWTPLHNAVQNGHVAVVSLLLSAGADVNAKLYNGLTALHLAAIHGHKALVELLLARDDTKLDLKDSFDRTPMLCAAEKYHYDIMQLLSPVHAARRLSPAARAACKKFMATVVDFGDFLDGKQQQMYERSVYEVLYGRNISTRIKNIESEPDFRWIHLPANNIAWAETLLSKWFIEGGHRDIEPFKALGKCFDQEHRGSLTHAHYMRTYCHRIPSVLSHGPGVNVAGDKQSPLPLSKDSVDSSADATADTALNRASGSIVLFMPFLHYETDERRERMTHAINSVRGGWEPPDDSHRDIQLTKGYISNTPPLHPRRTLDQFFYHGIDTSIRDTDQVVYRYCERHDLEKKVFMVDQLWMWVLGKDLVITCFPQRWDQPAFDPLNVLDGIIEEIKAKTGPRVQSVFDLAMLITNRCSGMFDRYRLADQDHQFLDMFDSSIGLVTNKEGELFSRFKRASVQSAEWLERQRRSSRGYTGGFASRLASQPLPSLALSDETDYSHEEIPAFLDELLDIGTETSLLAEIKDIRDELNILRVILLSQESMLTELQKNITGELKSVDKAASSCLCASGARAVDDLVSDGGGSTASITASVRADSISAAISSRGSESARLLETHLKDIDRMDRQAESICASLTSLLDLKQKHFNALEARFARDHAMSAARQGQTVMVFTIVTIIFLPMSFISTFFSMQITDWTSNLTLGYVSKYIFGIGLGISIPLIFLAFAVNEISAAAHGVLGAIRHTIWQNSHVNNGSSNDGQQRFENLKRPSSHQLQVDKQRPSSQMHQHQMANPSSWLNSTRTGNGNGLAGTGTTLDAATPSHSAVTDGIVQRPSKVANSPSPLQRWIFNRKRDLEAGTV